MARTVNPALHMVRRDAFLDVAQRLIQTKGYEAMSIQELLDQLEASKGAFYHYFDSKQALLEAVVVRFADGAMASLAPVLNDPELPALTKLERVFAGIASLKAEQKDLMLAIIEVWNSDGNAIVREKVRRLSERIMIPLFSAVVKQGLDEGTLRVDSPDDTAHVLVALMLGFQLQATDLFIARQSGEITFEVVQRAVAANTKAFERILGIHEGSLTLTDEKTLRFWFG
ncbi:MAG TPA: TetR/AcrR family transcriptional regulator [Candidatus Dormibacteraeota bacterium]|nr:TetR/AcrR family transcriptional regulator [Candidatus Dormibacteraeota bacterium]